MEIQKIFSNVEDPEENLYSVLMSEEELSLFSEFQKEFSETPFERSKRLEKSANQFKTKDELEKNISELKQILKQNKENYKEFGKYLPSYDRNMARGRNWGLQKTIEQKETYLNNWDKIKQEEKSKRRKDNLKALGYAGAALVSAPIIGIGVGKLLK